MDSVTFNVDHLKLKRGLYLSRIDEFENIKTLTFDLRTRIPYKEPVMSTKEMHTYEHAFATALRQVESKIKTVYFGPMGCKTGFYILLQINSNEFENFEEIKAECIKFLETAIKNADELKEVPAKNKSQCGDATSLGEVSDIKKMNEDVKSILENVIKNKDFDKYEYL